MAQDFDDDEEEEGPGLDAEVLKSYLTFGVRAIRKRPALVVLVFVGVMVLDIVVLALWPRSYYCEARMTAESVGALSGEGREDLDKLLAGAATSIMRYDNLEAIVKQTELTKHWTVGRAPLNRLKDTIMTKLFGERSEEELTAALVNQLQGALYVGTDFGILTIGVTWHEPHMAAQLVEATRQNFLESRHVSEISLFAQHISILEGHAAEVRNEVYEIADEIKALRKEKREESKKKILANTPETDEEEKAATIVRRTVRKSPERKAEDSEELASAKVMLDAKKRALQELERERVQSLASHRAQLNDLLLTYTDAHPKVVHTKMKIAALSNKSPQAAELQAEVERLEGQVKRLSAAPASAGDTATGTLVTTRSSSSSSSAPSSARLSKELQSLIDDSAGDIDPTILAQSELAMGRYSELQGRISGARLDLDRAQAAFKHRYKLMSPAEVPYAPSKPKKVPILLAGFAAAIALGLGLALVLELLTGRIVARWQVARLNVPILSDLPLPRELSR